MAWLKRTLLIWLLVLAVPAQGLAAATMAVGGSGHARPGEATALAASNQAPLPGPAAAGGDSGPKQHAAPAHCQQLLTADATDPSASASGSAFTKTHSCSACSSCCSPGALPHSLLAVPADAPAATRFATMVTAMDLVVVDGLERPPRTPPA